MIMYDVRTEFFLTEFIFDRLKTFPLSATTVIILCCSAQVWDLVRHTGIGFWETLILLGFEIVILLLFCAYKYIHY